MISARTTRTPVDYPDMAAAVAREVAHGDADAGIAIDGAGIGSAIAANKIRGIRAVMATSELIARYSREHNGANVLDARRHARRRGSGARDRDDLDRHTHARTALHCAAREDSRSRERSAGGIEMTRVTSIARLIDVIVQELAAANAAPATRCACHAVLSDCCPDRLQGVLDAGATRVGVHACGGAPTGIAAISITRC